ncbi:Pentatricopeptide repeat-containing protein, mitochondrial [Lachnellula hyalina]|uniref:Pentatricopeptide repeat-containing protein, mitochondrial n=1 Tax=Lachnellula hyalina TaxID=1316788 RepID=A0A8H8U2I8_9HELO|nr:Pentatricopeptide repeat-containing protein, mitochondrial [Lachnellula hyalina]TVY29017.1 Pentatricopeptide repeat-containing protein, mitochondrial [Lachnellula hyalina]
MLACGACRERCLQALVGTSIISTSPRPLIASTPTKVPLTQCYSQSRNVVNRRSRRPSDISSDRRKHTPWLTEKTQKNHYGGHADDYGRRPAIEYTGGVQLRRRDRKLANTMGNVLEKHPAYGNDPLKLAEFVRKALRGDDFDTAAAVVRAASKQIQCTVSWNHLIDWEMTKGRMNAALKTYNEMKKRGQIPDSHTFTIIIRGCTEHRDVQAALGKVLAIFQNMQTDKSPVKPNTIHLNAIIKMCARARNMDAMFGIVAQMPDKGPASPNNLTFTTIINALRIDAADDTRKDLTPMQKRQNTEGAILNARHLWKDIIQRWRSGGFWIDEELVCAMGRLMLLGQNQDRDDILSLIEQTMNIPRQVPQSNTSQRMESASQMTQESENARAGPRGTSANPDEDSAASSSDAFMAVTPPKSSPPGQSAGVYAKPGRNTLSLVLSALSLIKAKEAADKYWQIFVYNKKVKPDVENYHAYLRVLRVFRASSQTIELLQSMPYGDMRSSTFRIAMASCERDKRNPNAFANAGKILDIMTNALQVPDIRVLATYLDIATSAATSSDGLTLSRVEQGKKIMRALERLSPSFINVKSFYLFGEPERDQNPAERAEYRESVLLLTRRMIAAYGIIIDKELVERSRFPDLQSQRSKLSAFVTRQKEQEQRSYIKKGDIEELPDHLLQYVYRHRLNKRMVNSQLRPEQWQRFKERMQREYDAELKLAEAAQEMQGESTNSQELEEIAEEDRRAAEAVAKGIFAEPNGKSASKHRHIS